jgi:hypothetical protein
MSVVTEPPSSLDTAADELYALPPQDFTARRDEMSKSARSAGDRQLAASIKALKRPTTAAWLLNLSVHADLPELSELLTLGDELRQAQSELDGPRMKEVSARRQELEGAVLRGVARLAVENDQEVAQGVSVEIEATLRAAVADPDAATAVASGHLTRALSYAGFGGVDLSDATATPLGDRKSAKDRPADKASAKPPQQKPPTKKQPAKKPPTRKPPPGELATRRQAHQEEAERRASEQKAERGAERLRELLSALDEAKAAAVRADERQAEAEQAEQEAEALVEDLHQRLQDARETLSDATKEAASAVREQNRAHRALRAAERNLTRVQQETARD